MNIQTCKTENMKADMFTKSLPKTQFEYLRKQIGIEPNPALQSRESVEIKCFDDGLVQ